MGRLERRLPMLEFENTNGKHPPQTCGGCFDAYLISRLDLLWILEWVNTYD
jgi:hypothetical protein